MQAVETLDKEITAYLHKLSVPQKEAVLTVVKTFAGEDVSWNDKAYIAEMDKRFAELESGEVKGYTLEEMEAGAREAYQRKKTESAMNYTIRLHPLVKQDYDEAYEWYEDRQKGLGERFLKAVRNRVKEIVLHPEVYSSKGNKNIEKYKQMYFLT